MDEQSGYEPELFAEAAAAIPVASSIERLPGRGLCGDAGELRAARPRRAADGSAQVSRKRSRLVHHAEMQAVVRHDVIVKISAGDAPGELTLVVPHTEFVLVGPAVFAEELETGPAFAMRREATENLPRLDPVRDVPCGTPAAVPPLGSIL
jgi:hypothetical protein